MKGYLKNKTKSIVAFKFAYFYAWFKNIHTVFSRSILLKFRFLVTKKFDLHTKSKDPIKLIIRYLIKSLRNRINDAGLFMEKMFSFFSSL